MSDEKICMNCEKAYRRSQFDIKKYGNYQCSYECLKALDRTEYKKADDSCPLWVAKN